MFGCGALSNDTRQSLTEMPLGANIRAIEMHAVVKESNEVVGMPPAIGNYHAGSTHM